MMGLIGDEQIEPWHSICVAEERLHHGECCVTPERPALRIPYRASGVRVDQPEFSQVLPHKLLPQLKHELTPAYLSRHGCEADGFPSAGGGYRQGVTFGSEGRHGPGHKALLVMTEIHGLEGDSVGISAPGLTTGGRHRTSIRLTPRGGIAAALSGSAVP